MQYGHLKLVELLIEKGANVDHADEYAGETPLLIASKVRLLLSMSNYFKHKSHFKIVESEWSCRDS